MARKTLAELLGKEENPEVEAAAGAFDSEVGRIEQLDAQERLTPIEARFEAWRAAEVILEAVRRVAFVGQIRKLIKRLPEMSADEVKEVGEVMCELVQFCNERKKAS